MLGPPKSGQLDDPIRVSLDKPVPANHSYRHLERTLALAFVSSSGNPCGHRSTVDRSGGVAEKARRLGAVGYFRKPCDLDDIVTAVRGIAGSC
jgi:hypothetical protein